MSEDNDNVAPSGVKGSTAGITDAGNRTRYFVLAVLMVVYIFNFVDRQIIVILQESIKRDMGLSDAQLGLLSGSTFAIFYAVLGIPIARWADRANRRNIIALSLTVWSVMTAVCGLAQNFMQLALARIGVGIGEAGGSPPAHSIISDYFPPEKRATALSVYSVGIYVGIMVGLLAGGWIDEFFGWRMAFFVVGAPGILLALIVRFTIKEPPRGLSEGLTEVAAPPALIETLKLFWRMPSFRYIALGAGLTAFVNYGAGNFNPPFLSRIHGMSTGEISTWLAGIAGIGGGISVFLGGFLADRLGARDKRWYLWIPALGMALSTPIRIFAYSADDPMLTFIGFSGAALLDAFFLAPSIAASHSLVAPRLRALASSILFFFLNLIGLGLGPLFAGLISDMLEPTYGVESIRLSLIIVTLMGLFAAATYAMGARAYVRDLARKESD